MRRKFTILMFGLLLAVGWTNSAQAQRLPAEAPVKQLMKAAVKPQPIVAESMGVSVAHTKGLDALNLASPARANAPMRAGVDLNMKSISKTDADGITYTWTDSEGTHTSKATDVATKPEQMYELLREVYTNKDFPGPFYSAFTQNDVRERKVYYGAISGGWDITGPTTSNSSATMTSTSTAYKTVADGTSTASGYSYLPVWGYNYDYAQKNQMIYTASQLGLQDGDKITSITFYPRSGIRFSGGNVKLSIGNTTTNTFSSTSLITAGDLTQVAETGSITANSSLTEWTITFDHPFTYTGNNLLVQLETTAGTYGSNSSFYGVQLGTNVYQSIYSYGTNNPSRSRFLPKAKFGYLVEQEITYDPTQQIGDITISGTNNYAIINSIKVYSGSTTLFSWDFDTDGTASSTSTGYWPNGMNYSSWVQWGDLGIGLNEDLDPITLDSWLFTGYSSVTVEIQASNAQSDVAASLIVNGTANNITTPYSSSQGALEPKTWTINAQSHSYTEYDPDYYKPNQEGYTVLIVAVNNNAAPAEDEAGFDMLSTFTTKQEIIEYFRTNVDSIKLLTDGLRIGEASDYSRGTLFNCDGTYNKFFFLGKGQARQKADVVHNNEIALNHLLGEGVPFKFMFEEFSPTGGEAGAEIHNFYSLMNEGNVYKVIHDCASVIQNGHQFSMSGNTGEQAYAMNAMNFFVPDYRLKYWSDQYYNKVLIDIDNQGNPVWDLQGPYNVDGRIMNPYMTESTDGNPAFNQSLVFTAPSDWVAWYAQYNQLYAPKIGLYKITLEAVAEPVANVQEEGNRNYKVTLNWVSSLNEMSGHEVPQTYTVYYWDPETGEKGYLVVEGYTNVDGETGQTTLVYYVEQKPHSYVIEYIVEGSPDDADHDQFIAESNKASVVIPGWEDFVGLELDHHESDFEATDMANWYRNFLTVVNEDIYNGLTVSKITGYNPDDPNTPLPQMRQFNVYRWAIKEGVAQPEEKIATITFDQVSADQVHYIITYEDNQDILESRYERAAMDIPDQGWIRVKGNGDLVIWPNGYFVNFKSIIIKNGNDVLYEWHSSNANVDTDNPNLPSGWELSPGSKMMPYIVTSSGEKVCYMEGGGYIYIPNMLNHNPAYNNLTVEIVAYTDGGHVGRIEVNDKSQTVSNVANTYIWGTTENPISPNAAPRHDAKDNPSKSVKDVNSKASINN